LPNAGQTPARSRKFPTHTTIRLLSTMGVLVFLTGCEAVSTLTGTAPAPQAPVLEPQQKTAPAPESRPKPVTQAPVSPTKQAAEDLLANKANQPAISSATGNELTLTKPEAEKKIIRIAILLPLSGPSQKIGDDLLKAANIALFDHNNALLRLQPYDTKGTAEGAQFAATAALREGAEIILGPLFSASVKAVQPLAAAQKVNVLAFSTDMTAAREGVYLLGLTPHQQIARVLEFAYRQGLANFAILAPQTPYGDTAVASTQTVIRQLGLRLTQVSRYPANLPPGSEELQDIAKRAANYEARNWQLKQELKKLKGRQDAASKARYKKMKKLDTLTGVNFEALIIPEGGQTLRELAPLLSYYDIDPKKVQYIGTGLWADISLTTEPALVGGWFAAPPPAASGQFLARFKSIYGYTPPRISSLAYDAVALAGLLALEDGPDKFSRTNIENPDGFAGYNGIFRFTNTGLAERGLAVMQLGQQDLELLEAAPTSFTPAIN